MAKVHPGVVGSPGNTSKGPAAQERPRPLRRWSSGTMDFPSVDRGMWPPPAGTVSEGSNQVLGRSGLCDGARAPAEEYTRHAAKRVDLTETPPSGKIWLAALLAALGTFILAWLLSPGLRSDMVHLADFLSELDAAALRDWILSFGAFSPVVYFLVVVAQVIVSPIPAGPVTFVGAMIFGVSQGLALSMAGSVVGSVLVFSAARKWGEPLAIRLVGEETFYKYSSRLDPKGWWLFAILLVALMPDDAVCALAGLSTVTFRRFLVFMVVGRLPGATLTALLASDVVTQSAAGWILAGMVLVALVALGFVYRKRLESWILRRADEGKRGDNQ